MATHPISLSACLATLLIGWCVADHPRSQHRYPSSSIEFPPKLVSPPVSIIYTRFLFTDNNDPAVGLPAGHPSLHPVRPIRPPFSASPTSRFSPRLSPLPFPNGDASHPFGKVPLTPLSSRPNPTMQRAHLPTPPQSPSIRQLPIEPVNNSLALLNSLTAFYQQELHWTHHTRAALESAITSTIQRTISLSVDVDNVDSNFSAFPPPTPSTLSSAAGFLDDSDRPSVRAEPLSSKMKVMGLQQRRRNRKNIPRLKLGGIAPPILMQQGSRPSQRILEMFAELVESRMESCERVSNMVKRYHQGRDL